MASPSPLDSCSGRRLGIAIWGKVIATIDYSLQPSGGFCAELATATTIWLPPGWAYLSPPLMLVGGVVGIGLVQSIKSIQFKTVQESLGHG